MLGAEENSQELERFHSMRQLQENLLQARNNQKLELWNFANDILRRLLFLPLSLVLNGNLKQSETTTPPLDHNDNHVSSVGKSSWANASTNSRKGCCASDERGDPIFSPKKLSNGRAINLSSKTFDCLNSRSWIWLTCKSWSYKGQLSNLLNVKARQHSQRLSAHIRSNS